MQKIIRYKQVCLCIAAIGLCAFLRQAVAEGIGLSENARDPFISIIDLAKDEATRTTKIDLPGVALRGIIYSDAKAVAIVNDELAMVGDNWSGYKVEGIQKDRVVFNDGTRSYELVIPQRDTDTSAVQENTKQKIPDEPQVQGWPAGERQYYEGSPEEPMQRQGMYMPERKE